MWSSGVIEKFFNMARSHMTSSNFRDLEQWEAKWLLERDQRTDQLCTVLFRTNEVSGNVEAWPTTPPPLQRSAGDIGNMLGLG
uniref:Uncharacterized protein n=1 Tax=Pyxicephalus adspersus TaxID=30357 RepID=A0AAV2ZL17_PYXAD|nr:TPA: hypothetical protein GDO54_004080 [Pyxicephalus adspersus]